MKGVWVSENLRKLIGVAVMAAIVVVGVVVTNDDDSDFSRNSLLIGNSPEQRSERVTREDLNKEMDKVLSLAEELKEQFVLVNASFGDFQDEVDSQIVNIWQVLRAVQQGEPNQPEVVVPQIQQDPEGALRRVAEFYEDWRDGTLLERSFQQVIPGSRSYDPNLRRLTETEMVFIMNSWGYPYLTCFRNGAHTGLRLEDFEWDSLTNGPWFWVGGYDERGFLNFLHGVAIQDLEDQRRWSATCQFGEGQQ